jgi:hypothetical protein
MFGHLGAALECHRGLARWRCAPPQRAHALAYGSTAAPLPHTGPASSPQDHDSTSLSPLIRRVKRMKWRMGLGFWGCAPRDVFDELKIAQDHRSMDGSHHVWAQYGPGGWSNRRPRPPLGFPYHGMGWTGPFSVFFRPDFLVFWAKFI